MNKIKLNNNYSIPILGFGTFRTENGQETVNAVYNAIQSGYRHIDCAAIYGNEKSVGEGIKKSKINREELFITSKLWNDNKGYEETKKAFNQTLKDLNVEYLDLYLIHWPIAKKSRNNWIKANAETWKAMEELYEEGKIKAIGVSNFFQSHLDELMKTAKIKPMVNQIEIHPGLNQKETIKFCQENNIVVEAWAPFANGQIFSDETLKELSKKYKKSIAQIALNWIVNKNIVALSKSVNIERIKENLNVFDFKIEEEDILKIDNIRGYEGSGADPDNIDF